MIQKHLAERNSSLKFIIGCGLCLLTPTVLAQETSIPIDTILPAGNMLKPEMDFRSSKSEVPTFQVQPILPPASSEKDVTSFKYIPRAVYPAVFFQEQAIIHKNEFQVSGPIFSFENEMLFGSGRQENLIGIGQFNSATLAYIHTVNEKLYWELQLYTQKLSAPFRFNQTIGTNARVNYRLADKLSMHVFGGYSIMPQYAFQNYNFGASFSYEITDHWGIELGANRYYDSYSRQWNLYPVVIPYYRINKDTKIGIDIGPIIKDIIIQKRNKRSNNPTIGPPVPEFPLLR